MGRKLHIPGIPEGVDVSGPDTNTQAVINAMGQGLSALNNNMVGLLQSIGNQLDLLVRLECGQLNKHQFRDQLNAQFKEMQEKQEQASNALAAELEAQADADMDRLEAEQNEEEKANG